MRSGTLGSHAAKKRHAGGLAEAVDWAFSHTHQELEYRRLAASKVGLNFVVGPNGPKSEVAISTGST